MRFLFLLFLAALPALTAAQPGGFAPEESAKRMKVAEGLVVKLFAAEPDVRQPIFVKCDDRGRVWTIQYLQYPNPAGLNRVKVDRWSRAVYDRVPEPPPKGPRGADRITICEDTDGDGKADRFTDFVAGLNLCTGVEFGHDGVYVLQAPYLLFYPDRNRDDMPDRDPDVLLAGFGMEDAQSLANHLTWGPDGWLYGLNGSTTTCRIRGIEFQQGVWRYHPATKAFELFCEGGGNVFGLTFDDDGNLFYSSNLGLFWHAYQGAYYFKAFGKHGPLHNPYAYGWLDHVKHDLPTGGPTTGGTIYRGDAFPERFRGRFLAGDFLRHTASSWELKPAGATVTATFRELLLDSRDTWFGATDLCLAPDGAVYLSDFHDKRTAHPDPDADWDRSNGRIFKVEAANAKPPAKFDLTKRSSKELVTLLQHPNGWYADRARVLLAGRRDRTVWGELRDMATQQDPRLALRGLWALYTCGGLDNNLVAKLLKHPAEYVRAWTVRLLGDAKKVTAEQATRFAELARSDASPIVRAQLLATAKRLPGAQALPIIECSLLREASDDPVVAWLLWWAIENKAMSDRDSVVALFTSAANRQSAPVKANLGRIVRRYAAEGSKDGYAGAFAVLTALTDDERKSVLADLDRGLAERAVGLPIVGQGGLFESQAMPEKDRPKARRYDELPAEFTRLIAAEWVRDRTGEITTQLALRAGWNDARDRVCADVADPITPRGLLLQRLRLLEELATTDAAPVARLHLASRDAEVQKSALTILSRVGGPDAGRDILKHYSAMPAAVKSHARAILFGRKDWAKAFLVEVAAGRVPVTEVAIEEVRMLALLDDREIDAAMNKHWGKVTPGTPEEKLADMRRFSNDLRAGTGDAVRGKPLFAKHCGTCHKLHGDGGTVGPDLSTTTRGDTASVLASIVDPSAVVRSQYVPVAVRTSDEVIYTGLVAEQDGGAITLVDAKGDKTRITRDRIASIRELSVSLMPEKLLDVLTPQERRDLFRYLQQEKP